MKRQYLNAQMSLNKILLLILLIPFTNMKASSAKVTTTQLIPIADFLSSHLTKTSLVVGGFSAFLLQIFYSRDVRTDEKGNWKLPGHDKPITDEDRWQALKGSWFFSQDTLPYLFDKYVGTIADYKTGTEQVTVDGKLREYPKTFCFATGSGPLNWLHGTVLRHTNTAVKDAAVVVTALSIVKKAVNTFNPNKEQEKKPE